jgi:hypothetical protein
MAVISARSVNNDDNHTKLCCFVEKVNDNNKLGR